MEAKLKSIEEKLDVIIAALSVNPEFENYVQEGLRNIEVKKIAQEINDRIIFEEGFSPAYKERIEEMFGSMPKLEEEIAKLK